MKGYKLAIFLVVILIVLGGIATWDEWQTKKEESEKAAQAKIANFAADQVTGLEYFSKGTSEEGKPANPVAVKMEKVEGKWRITEPGALMADQEAVASMLTSIVDYKVDIVVDKSGDKAAEYGLIDPERRVKLAYSAGSEKKEFVLEVGDKAPVGYSMYFRTSNDSAIKMGSQYLFVATTKGMYDFRDKSFVRLTTENINRLEYRRKSFDDVIITKASKDDWEISAPLVLPADRTEILDFFEELNAIRVTEFRDSNDATLRDLFSSPGIQVKLTFADGANQTLEFAFKDSILYGRNGEQIVVIPSDLNTKLSKELIDFRNRRIFTFDMSTIKQVRIDEKTFVQKGVDWSPEGASSPEEKSNHIRSLLVDLEFAKTREFLNRSDSRLAALTKPMHRIVLNKESGTALQIDILGEDGLEHFFVVTSTSGDIAYSIPRQVFDGMTEKKEEEQEAIPEEGVIPADPIDSAGDIEEGGLQN